MRSNFEDLVVANFDVSFCILGRTISTTTYITNGYVRNTPHDIIIWVVWDGLKIDSCLHFNTNEGLITDII